MKRASLFTAAVLVSGLSYSQSGIDTQNPRATLDVAASPADPAKTDGVIAPRLTGDQLKAKDNLYDADLAGTIVYVTAAADPVTAKTQHVTAPGYYYFDGTAWIAFGTGGGTAADNGLTQTGNTIRLGGSLNQPTAIGTSGVNPLRVTGLEPAGNNDNIVMVGSDGTLRQSQPNTVKGTLETTYYIQGTDEITVNGGQVVDVPGVFFTHTVPGTVTSQTLFFTVTGYVTKPGDGTDGSTQGVFELYQDGIKISSAYVSVSNGTGGSQALNNLPTPCTMLKSVTLPPGTYFFKVSYASWAHSGIVNRVPSNYAGYNNDTESMLTKMSVIVFND